MTNKSLNVRIIGYALALLYAFSFVGYLGHTLSSEVRVQAILLVSLFAILLVASIATAMLEEWGRRLLVWGNVVAFACILGIYLSREGIAPIAYIFFCFVVAVFFGRPQMRVLFGGSMNFERKSILVIDDDEMLLKTLKPVLLANGYSVLTAMTGEKGLQIVKKQKPDLILLDVLLPGIKGREVCARIKDDPNIGEVPVIFLTAKDSPDDVRAEIEAGGISHITKPFRNTVLLEEVKKALGK